MAVTVFGDLAPTVLIPTAAICGIIFALVLWKRVAEISLVPGASSFRASNGREYLLEEEQRGDDEVRREEAVRECVCQLTPRNGRRGLAQSLARPPRRLGSCLWHAMAALRHRAGGAAGWATRKTGLAARCAGTQPPRRGAPPSQLAALEIALLSVCASGGPAPLRPCRGLLLDSLSRGGSITHTLHAALSHTHRLCRRPPTSRRRSPRALTASCTRESRGGRGGMA